jgi:hypothetical protein
MRKTLTTLAILFTVMGTHMMTSLPAEAQTSSVVRAVTSNTQIVSVSPLRDGTIPTVLGSFNGAHWVFDGQGNFALYATSNLVRRDLVPIRGRYTVQGNVLRFSGSARSQIGYTGLATADLDGTITLQGRGGVGQATHIVSSSTSAVILGKGYGFTNTRRAVVRFSIV